MDITQILQTILITWGTVLLSWKWYGEVHYVLWGVAYHSVKGKTEIIIWSTTGAQGLHYKLMSTEITPVF